MANSNSPISLTAIHQFDRPAQDEWGMFDPRQAGLEALLRKIQSRAKDTHVAQDLTPTATSK